MILTLVCILGALLVVPSATAQETDLRRPVDCPRYLLAEHMKPVWTVSGDWTSPSELVLVDTRERRLLRFSPKGRFLGQHSKSVQAKIQSRFEMEKFSPSSISTGANGTWLQFPVGKVAKLGPGDEVENTLDLWHTPVVGERERGDLISILEWTLAGHEVFGYGHFRLTDDTLRSGFFRVNLEDTSDARILKSFHENHPGELWFRLGFHLLTASDGTAYAVVIDDYVTLAKSTPGNNSLETVDAFPDDLRELPELPGFRTPDDYVKLMKTVEKTTMPVGLYAWEGDLYLLWRREGYEWLLSKIDPQEEELIGTAVLPTKANHIMLIPGPEYWGLLEKGPVRGFGQQESDSLRFIPKREIREFQPGEAICE